MIQTDRETNNQCENCWNPVPEDFLVKFRGKKFCCFDCLVRYYRCVISVCLGIQIKKLRIFIFHKKGWSTGIVAGIIFSFFLIATLAFILSSPVSRPPKLPPVTEAMVNIPFLPPSPFSPRDLTVNMAGSNSANIDSKNSESEGLENLQERRIKDRVRIDLIKEYPITVQKTVGISGQALEESICALYLNNRLYDATTCIKSKFFFPRVALLPGVNIIEVIAYDSIGRTIPSNSIELFVDFNRKMTEKGKNITRGSLENKNICLTFDGGASASCAPEILDMLKRYRISCTFFLTGDFLRNHPYLVKRMIQLGHEIGNHTDTHPHLASLNSNLRFKTLPWVNREFVHNQLKKAEEAFFRITGKRMAPFWRSPYGEHNLEILKWAEEIGYVHVGWTCGRILEEGLDTLDWVYNSESPIYYSAKEIREKIVGFGEDTPEGANGGIVLMHLASSRPAEDRIHYQIPAIIEGLRKRGYHLSRVSDIIEFQQEKGESLISEKKARKSGTKTVKTVKTVKKKDKSSNNSQKTGRRRFSLPKEGG